MLGRYWMAELFHIIISYINIYKKSWTIANKDLGVVEINKNQKLVNSVHYLEKVSVVNCVGNSIQVTEETEM